VLITLIFTSSTLWTVPLDWSNLNTIQVIGGGQGGGSYYRWSGGSRLNYGYGGAGAGYVSVTNLSVLVPIQMRRVKTRSKLFCRMSFQKLF
jgi:hypothetical protein